MAKNQNRSLHGISSRDSILLLVERKIPITALLICLTACSQAPVKVVETTTTMPRPSELSTVTLPTTFPSPTNTTSATPTKTPTPSFTSTPTPFLTPKKEVPSLFDHLSLGDYLILDDGIYSFSSKTIAHDVFPNGRLSIDSKRLVSVSELNNNYFYDVIDLVTGDQWIIPVLDNCETIYPAWSPDGKMLITACSDNQLIIQSFPGGDELSRYLLKEPDKLEEFEFNYPRWSLDGKWVAYIQFNHDMGPNARGDEVFILDSDCFFAPAISCDGTKKLAVKIISNGWNQIDWASKGQLVILEQDKQRFLVYDVNLAKIIRVIALPSRFAVPGFAVSSDGNRIFFGQLTSDETGSAIYEVSLSNGSIEKIYYEEGLTEIWVDYFLERH